jgi:hypothetical protein
MKHLTIVLPTLALAVFTGCVSCRKPAAELSSRMTDPVIGNWSAALPEKHMPASSLIFSRDAAGKPTAFVLYRWASPEFCRDVKISGNTFSLRHPNGMAFEGEVQGDRLIGRIASYDRKTGKVKDAWRSFEGWRNPPIPTGVSTDQATFGQPIDILKDGLAGFKAMGGGQMEKTWSFSNGVLSNRVVGPDGKRLHGANIVTTREDFYDFKLDYDVRVPKGANSGMYLRGRIEIQTLDSYGKRRDRHHMGAYYGRVAPSVTAEKPAGEWQHVTVVLYKRHLTVTLNGKRIIDNAPVEGVTGGAIDANLFTPGPLYIQGDHSDADYRNIILRPAL